MGSVPRRAGRGLCVLPWVLGLLTGTAALAAGPQQTADTSRAEVVARLERSRDAFIKLLYVAGPGKLTPLTVMPGAFTDDFERAVALYSSEPGDAAAVEGLGYVFLYCKHATPAEQARCAQVMPAAQQVVLAHHAENPALRSAIFSATDLDFLDALFEKNGPLKLTIAELAGRQWLEKFHDPATDAAERRRAYEMAVKYGEAMAASEETSTISGRTVPMTRWKGLGTLNSVQRMAVGHVMPDFGFTTLDGEPASLRSQRGKVLLIDFWATWCAPCVAGMPEIEQFRERMAGKPFEVISVNAGDSIEKVIQFQRKEVSMPWINWHKETRTKEYSGMGLKTLPTYFVLGPDGAILARGKHFDERIRATIISALEGAG